MDASALAVAGVTPFTTIDFPGALAAVVFCRGCPWKCPYCHNAHLQDFGTGNVAWDGVVHFLEKRTGWLNGVVFSGGEPIAQAALPQAMAQVRSLGFKVGLHTGGYHPERFAHALALADWVGFDVKAPFGPLYDQLTGRAGASVAARDSLLTLLDSGKPFQLRTTVDPSLLDESALSLLDRQLIELGAPPAVRQKMNPPAV